MGRWCVRILFVIQYSQFDKTAVCVHVCMLFVNIISDNNSSSVNAMKNLW